ncbi:uncharacterized protein MYCGRDRAFT_106565 [Zymoseptoria tritici IPO323]|uniref:CHCH domain-containing protein n=1 Tax=Zymoseptoria tritici (strain CBS 115943 / IPO323) TaxID=336722 RepID=F9XQF4_ZYMTI|nr:uncharacterized protein MYCGRDRAFT_106565 [Zymoseptoria tritici IPO323]EGP82633.1 hypothetical protein MYCGRDRAFT_106565 [Zymoseptoria tritici IPO323]
MPRQSRGPASAPRRPTVQQRPAPPTQARPASTSAAQPQRPQAQAPPQAQSGGSGLFGQMASTAAGVAVGSSIGHAVGGWFGGGSSSAQQEQAAPVDQQDNGMYQSSAMSQSNAAQGACANDVNNFRQCMDQNQGSLTICGWYLDQLKACQQAASQY